MDLTGLLNRLSYFCPLAVSAFLVVSFLAASIESCFIIAFEAFIKESMWATAAKESAFCLAALSAELVQETIHAKETADKISFVFIKG
jgi:hypothetical protein